MKGSSERSESCVNCIPLISGIRFATGSEAPGVVLQSNLSGFGQERICEKRGVRGRLRGVFQVIGERFGQDDVRRVFEAKFLEGLFGL